MSNQTLFQSLRGKLLRLADAVNHEGAPAYAFAPRHALAQYATTGCLNHTFYATAEAQLEKVLSLCSEVDSAFIAKTAVFSREAGYMKDMPALLCAVLATKDAGLLQQVFPRVIDNGRMLRNFVQIIRSGAVGRKSFGSLPKRLVCDWLEKQSDQYLFEASVGQNPALSDVIKMVHPKPRTARRAALYGYLLGRPTQPEALPQIVRDFEAYKSNPSSAVPSLPFQMLTALNLGQREWIEIARRAPWQMTRMNLNTFARHGVFAEKGMTGLIANRLRDQQAIARAKVFPYQLLIAYKMADEAIPREVQNALQDAMEVAIANVPRLQGKVYVCPDVSGSMREAAATGYRSGASSKVRCVDIAALMTAAILRQNPEAEILPFADRVVKVRLNPRDSVMTNAGKLAALGGGGTNCSAPLKGLNAEGAIGDMVIFISDNQSWVDARFGGQGTALMREWNEFQQRNPAAKLVCLDIQPYATSQSYDRTEVLNIGGFSDQVFQLIADFAENKLHPEHWAGLIEQVSL